MIPAASCSALRAFSSSSAFYWSAISLISIYLTNWEKTSAKFVSYFAEHLTAPMKPYSSANASRFSCIWKSYSDSPFVWSSSIKSSLLRARIIGILESLTATTSSTCYFHSAVYSIDVGSVKDPTRIAPEAFRQKERLMPAKVVSMPTRSQI